MLSETCEFLGVSGSLDTSMADALLAGGAKAVAGYVNNVYTVYSRSMLWDTVNHLILGQTLQESVQHSMDTKEMCGQVIYPAAVMKNAHHAEAAKEFLAYLRTDKAATVFESVGFTAL